MKSSKLQVNQMFSGTSTDFIIQICVDRTFKVIRHEEPIKLVEDHFGENINDGNDNPESYKNLADLMDNVCDELQSVI